MEIKGKVAIVSGGARRVGRAIVLALARKGARVAVHFHSSKQDSQRTVNEARLCGAEAIAVRADLSRHAENLRLVRETVRRFSQVDILVNCASLYKPTPFGRIREKDWDNHMNLNLKSAFVLSQEASQYMLRARRGKIVNIIDSDVHRPYIGYLPYLVSKSGMVGLTYCLAKELAPHIQVNAVSPGPVLLPEHWGEKARKAVIAETPLKRIGSPEDIARSVLFCIEGTDFMTGAVIPVDGGQHIA